MINAVMKNDASTDSESTENTSTKVPGDFLIGLVTFVVFVIFMTAWMYYRLDN